MMVVLMALSTGVSSGASRPRPPQSVAAQRQDFQAARITWKSAGPRDRYRLYASYDQEPLDFHTENNGEPLSATYAIWDAPRTELRRFVFYVTTVNAEGVESEPSKRASVDLGPLPRPPAR